MTTTKAQTAERTYRRIHADDADYIIKRMSGEGWKLVDEASPGDDQLFLTFERAAAEGCNG